MSDGNDPEGHNQQKDDAWYPSSIREAVIELIASQAATNRANAHRAKDRNRPKEGCATWLTGIGTVAGAAFAFISVIIFAFQLQEARDEQRPWITTEGASVSAVGADNKPLPADSNDTPSSIIFDIAYQNTGKLPALNTTYNITAGSVPGFPNMKSADSEIVGIPKNETCKPIRDGNPTANPRNGTTLDHQEWFSSDKKVLSAWPQAMQRKRTLYIQGCFSYEERGHTRQTGFCYWAVRSQHQILMPSCPNRYTNFSN